MSYILDPKVLKQFIDTGRLPADYWEVTKVCRAAQLALNLRGRPRFHEYMAMFHSHFSLAEVAKQMEAMSPSDVSSILGCRLDSFENWCEMVEISSQLIPTNSAKRIQTICLKGAAKTAVAPDQKKVVLGLLRKVITEDDQHSELATIYADILAKLNAITSDFDGLYEMFGHILPWNRELASSALRQMLHKANTTGQCELVASCCTHSVHDSVHVNAVDKFFLLAGLK